MEQIKILDIINRWGYLDTYQIARLLNKSVRTTDTLLRLLKDKRLILVNKQTKKNIYTLSPLGNKNLGKDRKKTRINLHQLEHQDLMIKWLTNKSNVTCYETELELKQFNSKKDIYPDLIIEFENKTKAVVEVERTRKAKIRIENKLDDFREYIEDNYQIIWVVPNKKMKNFIKEQVDNYGYRVDQHIIEIFKMELKNEKVI